MNAPALATERAVLIDYLSHYRAELERKCAGLEPEQLAARSVPPSTLSLLGMVRHLAKVERYWFHNVMGGHLEDPRLYVTAQDKDADYNGAVGTAACVEEAWTAWHREVAAASSYVEATASLETIGQHSDGPLHLREVLVHMIEEYARHLGHVDLLRECIDGMTGD